MLSAHANAIHASLERLAAGGDRRVLAHDHLDFVHEHEAGAIGPAHPEIEILEADERLVEPRLVTRGGGSREKKSP